MRKRARVVMEDFILGVWGVGWMDGWMERLDPVWELGDREDAVSIFYTYISLIVLDSIPFYS
jgi:hypothetical protein